jgi:hypothetical protein
MSAMLVHVLVGGSALGGEFIAGVSIDVQASSSTPGPEGLGFDQRFDNRDALSAELRSQLLGCLQPLIKRGVQLVGISHHRLDLGPILAAVPGDADDADLMGTARGHDEEPVCDNPLTVAGSVDGEQ